MLHKPYVAAVGGANCDIHIKLDQTPVMRDSNPGHFSTSAGGVARNIAENIARLGLNCAILTSIAADGFGEEIKRSCTDAGIDISHIHISDWHPTGCYVNILDETGDMFLASSDMSIIENLPISHIEQNAELLANASAVVLDANLLPEQIEAVVKAANGSRIFADPVSTVKAKRLVPFVGDLYLIKPNLMELEALSGINCESDEDIEKAADVLLAKGLEKIVVSLGARGAFYKDKSGRSLFKPLEEKAEIVSATGAGDAFLAGLVRADAEGLSPQASIDFAQSCSRMALASPETINPEISALKDKLTEN